MAGHIVYPMDHPLMEDPTRVRGHARCALARAASSIEALRHPSISDEGLMLRQHQALRHEVVRELDLRFRDLQTRYLELGSEGCVDPGAAWQRFFDRYDGFLDALRRCRSEIAAMQARQPVDDRTVPSTLPQPSQRVAASGGR